MTWFVYTLTCFETGKVYVGRSINPRRRWCEHRSDAKKGDRSNQMFEDVRKHGEKSFTLSIVGEYKTEEDARIGESLTIAELNTLFPMGYNLNSEQGPGLAHHEITKQRISKVMKGHPAHENTKRAASETHLGVAKAEEHRSKISLALKGKPKSEEARQSMSVAAKHRKVSRLRNDKGRYV